MIVKGTNLHITRGDTEGIIVRVIDEAGEDVSLGSGDVVEFTVRRSASHPEKMIHKVINTFENGEALITLYPEDTDDLPFGNCTYDIQLTRANGDVKTIVKPSKFVIGTEVSYD